MPVALWSQVSFKLQKLQLSSKQEVGDVRRVARAESNLLVMLLFFIKE